jgi:peptide/nickel transport system permease protein
MKVTNSVARAERVGIKPLNLRLAACAAVIGVFGIATFFPSVLAPGDPLIAHAQDALQPPNSAHLFGTDQAGRDVYTRVVHGTASTLGAAVLATVMAVVVGGSIGMLSAFGPRWERAFALRTTEVGLAIPEFILALLILAYFGRGSAAVTFAVGIATMPGYMRVAAMSTRAVLGSDAVRAARILGVTRFRLVCRHVFPTAFRPVLALGVLGVATAMLAIAGLTFLGLGVQPPAADWGLMMAQGKSVVRRAWWVVVIPGIVLGIAAGVFTVLSRLLQTRAEKV